MALQGKFILNDADYSPLNIFGVGVFMAFSGNGVYRNHGGCSIIPDNGPIPPGRYWVVDRSAGSWFATKRLQAKDLFYKTFGVREFGRSDWFALYRDDLSIDDETWVDGVARGLFRLHPGTSSKGCITIVHNSDFALIRNALMRTHPVPVPCMKNLQARGYIEVIANGTACP